MGTFRTKLYDICGKIASEFENWSFVSGIFKNTTLQYATLTISPGFVIKDDNASFQPRIAINHKKAMRLFKKLNGYDQPTSIILFQDIAHLLKHVPEEFRLGGWILENKDLQITLAPPSEQTRKRMIGIEDVRPVLKATMLDGVDLIDKLYDFGSEESFLRNLPAKYTTRSDKIPYDEFERHKGVMMCIVHALLGDFDFVDNYGSDNYQTIFPKRVKELKNLFSALPDLKEQYSKSGKII